MEKRNRILTWTLVILVIVNVAALASFFLFTGKQEPPACCPEGEQQCNAFCEQLNLDPSQAKTVGTITDRYTAVAAPLALRIRDLRSEIVNELERLTPDTLRTDSLARVITSLQLSIQKENIRQYLALKQVCSKDQALRLSGLYRELYGCPMKNGAQHRYRHGQMKQDQ